MDRHDLTVGSVPKKLISFALPFLFANLMQALYSAVDMFVVGRFSGTSAIAAVNTGGQIMQLITGFITGVTMGATITLGQRMGAKDDEGAARTVGAAILLFGLFALVLTPVMAWQADALTTLMQTPAQAFAQTARYVMICSCGLPFIVSYNVMSGILRGMGDSKTPMLFAGVACVVNIFGDLLLTGVLRMGVSGAAIATIAAQAVSSVWGLAYIKRHGLPFRLSKKDVSPKNPQIKPILSVGIPIAMQDTLIGVSFMLLTVIANARGLIAASAVGVVEKVIMFMFLVPSAMLSAISAITAQNIGAGLVQRAKESVKYGVLITGAFGCAVCLISWICPDALNGIFTNDADVITEAGQYLRTYSIDCILVAITFGINGYLCGTGKSMIVFAHNTIAVFLVRIPAAYLLSRAFPSTLLPMGLASPLGSVASIIILFAYMAWTRRRERAPA